MWQAFLRGVQEEYALKSDDPWWILAIRYIYLFGGMLMLAAGISLVLNARLGLSSWAVFHKALENLTPFTFGRITQMVGLALILVSMFLGVWPRLATLLNMFFVGFFIDLLRATVVPRPEILGARVAALAAGIVVLGFGVAMYLSANLGAGPRDTLMIALVEQTGRQVGEVRVGIELTVLVVGWLLSGPVGVGTVLTALLTGPVVQFFLRLFDRLSRVAPFSAFIEVPVGKVKTEQGKKAKVSQGEAV